MDARWVFLVHPKCARTGILIISQPILPLLFLVILLPHQHLHLLAYSSRVVQPSENPMHNLTIGTQTPYRIVLNSSPGFHPVSTPYVSTLVAFVDQVPRIATQRVPNFPRLTQ